jgi:hypothetical protein
MKRLLISAAIFAAISGTAFAQANSTGMAPATPAAPTAPNATDNNVPAPTPQAAPMASDAPAAPTAPMSAPMASPPPAAATGNATDTSAAVAAPNTSYPICKTRSQDHCRVAKRR